MKFYIFDIDNCVSNDDWRMPRIRWEHEDPDKRYHDYHSLAPFDALGNAHLFPSSREHVAFFFTARPERYRLITHEWLNRNLPEQMWDRWMLYMRANLDHRGSVEIKQEMLDAVTSLNSLDASKVECCYDDRQDVVEMYRANDFRAERVWIHTQTVWKEKHR